MTHLYRHAVYGIASHDTKTRIPARTDGAFTTFRRRLIYVRGGTASKHDKTLLDWRWSGDFEVLRTRNIDSNDRRQLPIRYLGAYVWLLVNDVQISNILPLARRVRLTTRHC